jgi:DNA-binding NarL/FixJ family response regulator
MSFKILVVDDHEIMCEGIAILLGKHPEYEIVGHAPNGLIAMKMVDELSPDLVIMDIEMPHLDGIDATRRMIAKRPELKVLALSAHLRRSTIVKMLKAGAAGYMHKESAFSELTEGLKAVREDRTYLCSKAAKVAFDDYLKMLTVPDRSEGDGLTKREREVLQYVSDGNTTKKIAKTLDLSVKTVDSHREHIMDKLGIRNIAGLTKYATREGLTTLD